MPPPIRKEFLWKIPQMSPDFAEFFYLYLKTNFMKEGYVIRDQTLPHFLTATVNEVGKLRKASHILILFPSLRKEFLWKALQISPLFWLEKETTWNFQFLRIIQHFIFMLGAIVSTELKEKKTQILIL